MTDKTKIVSPHSIGCYNLSSFFFSTLLTFKPQVLHKTKTKSFQATSTHSHALRKQNPHTHHPWPLFLFCQRLSLSHHRHRYHLLLLLLLLLLLHVLVPAEFTLSQSILQDGLVQLSEALSQDQLWTRFL